MHLPPRGSSLRHQRRRRTRPISEINVTPMVDVMLVLLIVFMVAAPLLTVGVPVDLPKVQAKTLESKSEPIVITVTKEGKVFLKDFETNIDALVKQLVEMQKTNPELKIYLRGDKDIPYGAVMVIMGKLNAAGIVKVALVAELPQKTGSAIKETLSTSPKTSASSESFPR